MAFSLGLTWEKSSTYAAQLQQAGLYVNGVPAFAPGPGLGVQLMAPTKARHRMLVCGQGKARFGSVCIASDDHGVSWVGAGDVAINETSALPSEASVVELLNGACGEIKWRLVFWRFPLCFVPSLSW